MNRRSFFTKLGLAATSLAVLPAATTYARKWIATTGGSTLFVPRDLYGDFKWIPEAPDFGTLFMQDCISYRNMLTSVNFGPILPRYNEFGMHGKWKFIASE